MFYTYFVFKREREKKAFLKNNAFSGQPLRYLTYLKFEPHVA